MTDLDLDAIAQEAAEFIKGAYDSAGGRAQNAKLAEDLLSATGALLAEVRRLREALEEIAEGRGPFSRDQLTFAENVIESNKAIARRALTPEPRHDPAT